MGHKVTHMAGVLVASWMFWLLVSQPVIAGVMISDGSSGEFHPVTDTVIDLSGASFPQFGDILIDAGITLKVLLPQGGTFGRLLAQNDIILNGIIDAGGGALSMEAGHSIVMGSNARIIGGDVFMRGVNINPGGGADAGWYGTVSLGHIDFGTGDPITVRSSGNIRPLTGFDTPLSPGTGIHVLSSGNVPEPDTLLLMLPLIILIAFRKRYGSLMQAKTSVQ